MSRPGIPLVVNGTPRRLSLRLRTQGAGPLPAWTAEVDGILGCAWSLETAILIAAVAAEIPNGQPVEKETRGEGRQL